NDSVSPRHVKLTVSAQDLIVEDLGSTHGTYVNGMALKEPTSVGLNQSILLGELFLTVQNHTTNTTAPRLYIPGDMIGGGRYSLIREIGRGGGGVVWLAQDEHLKQPIAIKRLPPELVNDATALNDLIGEVQKARMLSHPHIIRIHDYVKLTDELPFVTMEFVDGCDLGTLRNQQENGYFKWDRLEGLANQMCEALQYAHGQQIIHRDLKPANIMITRKGNLKLADFGIAASISDLNPQNRMEGDASGTMVYMSPQQMNGILPTPTDDIYALGATLYDLLTTRPPFYEGDIYRQTQESNPVTISQRISDFGLNNNIPTHVESAIMECLAKNPAERPTDAGALAKLLHPGDITPPSPPTPPEEMESVLAESFETTQRFFEKNTPGAVKSWWHAKPHKHRDLLLACVIILILITLECVFSKVQDGQFFKTIHTWRPFLPW
ncbi:MAG: serine/threonine-protein kinase, partial [Verrucomicrobiota bacterium]|nr:serine/threonine-protein kinase [Verrucomicrobiota bacterium]